MYIIENDIKTVLKISGIRQNLLSKLFVAQIDFAARSTKKRREKFCRIRGLRIFAKKFTNFPVKYIIFIDLDPPRY